MTRIHLMGDGNPHVDLEDSWEYAMVGTEGWVHVYRYKSTGAGNRPEIKISYPPHRVRFIEWGAKK